MLSNFVTKKLPTTYYSVNLNTGSSIQMVDFRQAQAFDNQNIWLPYRMNRTTYYSFLNVYMQFDYWSENLLVKTSLRPNASIPFKNRFKIWMIWPFVLCIQLPDHLITGTQFVG
jgi:hypothetical protein